jgi:hypothetical protein
MTGKSIYTLFIPLFLFGNTILDAAVLDDLFNSIHQDTTHKKYHKRRYRKHHHRTVSDKEKWQISLKFLGYYHGKIDGDLLTPESYNAIKDFQQRNQYFGAGILEHDSKEYLMRVYEAIRLNNYLNYEGENRQKLDRKIQAALAAKGIYPGKIDGRIGKKTKNAILVYRQSLEQNVSNEGGLSPEEKDRLFVDAKNLLEKRLENFKEEASFSPDKKADSSGGEAASRPVGKSSMADILDSDGIKSEAEDTPSKQIRTE